jgi:hypothetical protein
MFSRLTGWLHQKRYNSTSLDGSEFQPLLCVANDDLHRDTNEKVRKKGNHEAEGLDATQKSLRISLENSDSLVAANGQAITVPPSPARCHSPGRCRRSISEFLYQGPGYVLIAANGASSTVTALSEGGMGRLAVKFFDVDSVESVSNERVQVILARLLNIDQVRCFLCSLPASLRMASFEIVEELAARVASAGSRVAVSRVPAKTEDPKVAISMIDSELLSPDRTECCGDVLVLRRASSRSRCHHGDEGTTPAVVVIVWCGFPEIMSSFVSSLDSYCLTHRNVLPIVTIAIARDVVHLLIAALQENGAKHAATLCSAIAKAEASTSDLFLSFSPDTWGVIRVMQHLRRRTGAVMRSLLVQSKVLGALAAAMAESADGPEKIREIIAPSARALASIEEANEILVGMMTRTSAAVQLRNRALIGETDSAALLMTQLNSWSLPACIITNLLSMSVPTPNEFFTFSNDSDNSYNTFLLVVTAVVILLAMVILWEATETRFDGLLRQNERLQKDRLRQLLASSSKPGFQAVEVSRGRHMVYASAGGSRRDIVKAFTPSSLMTVLSASREARQKCSKHKKHSQMRYHWLDILRPGASDLVRALSSFSDQVDVDQLIAIVSAILVDSVAGRAAALGDLDERPLNDIRRQQWCGTSSFCVGLVCLDGSHQSCAVAVAFIEPNWTVTVRSADIPALQHLQDELRVVAASREEQHSSPRLSYWWLVTKIQEGAISASGRVLAHLLSQAQELEDADFGEPLSCSDVGPPTIVTILAGESGSQRCMMSGDAVGNLMRRVTEIRRALNTQSKFLLAVEQQSTRFLDERIALNISTELYPRNSSARPGVAQAQIIDVARSFRGRYCSACASLQRITSNVVCMATAQDTVATAGRNAILLWFTELNAACLPVLLVFKVFAMSIPTPLVAHNNANSLIPFWVICAVSSFVLTIFGLLAICDQWKTRLTIKRATAALHQVRSSRTL